MIQLANANVIAINAKQQKGAVIPKQINVISVIRVAVVNFVKIYVALQGMNVMNRMNV